MWYVQCGKKEFHIDVIKRIDFVDCTFVYIYVIKKIHTLFYLNKIIEKKKNCTMLTIK